MSEKDKDCFNILIFHGSSSKESIESVQKFRQSLSHLLNNFCICFLKTNSPSLEESLEKAYNNGYKQIKCFPLFVLPGNHLIKDIPDIINDFVDKHEDCSIDLLPCLIDNNLFNEFVINSLN